MRSDRIMVGGRSMNILLVALEVSPYLNEGSLAQSCQCLGRALADAGEQVRIVAPFREAYAEYGLLLARRGTPLSLNSGKEVHVFDVQLPTGVQLSLLRPASNEQFEFNDPAALGDFSEAVVELTRNAAARQEPIEVMQAFGAEAALCFAQMPPAHTGRVVKVFTFHATDSTPRFSISDAGALAIPPALLHQEGYAQGEAIDLLKGAIATADRVVVPSLRLARELTLPEYGGRLARVLATSEPVGIVEGIDTALFNPATDAALASRYDGADPSNKRRNRDQLMADLKPPLKPTAPLIFAQVSEGDDLTTLLGTAAELSATGVNLLIEAKCGISKVQAKAAEELNSFVHLKENIDSKSRRQLLAAADFCLLLDEQSVTGTDVMSAARYGAIPLALARGANADVIVDCDESLTTGTGFLFDQASRRGLVHVIARSLAALSNPRFPHLVRRVMRRDAGWDRASQRYQLLYRRSLESST